MIGQLNTHVEKVEWKVIILYWEYFLLQQYQKKDSASKLLALRYDDAHTSEEHVTHTETLVAALIYSMTYSSTEEPNTLK